MLSTFIMAFLSRSKSLLILRLYSLSAVILEPKEINPEYSLEGQMLKLKLQYFDHLMQRNDSLEKILMLAGRD